MTAARRGWIHRWWAFHGVMLAMCVVAVALAFVLTPGAERVALLGVEIPALCFWKRVFGLDCPGCGMTRSWVYLAHGDWRTALSMNVLGPVLFLAALVQIPLSTWRLVRLWRRRRAAVSATERPWPS